MWKVVGMTLPYHACYHAALHQGAWAGTVQLAVAVLTVCDMSWVCVGVVGGGG
jgi:hypothetical protein